MKRIRDLLMDEGVFCPEHGFDYDMGYARSLELLL